LPSKQFLLRYSPRSHLVGLSVRAAAAIVELSNIHSTAKYGVCSRWARRRQAKGGARLDVRSDACGHGFAIASDKWLTPVARKKPDSSQSSEAETAAARELRSFECALAEVEEIVGRLENGQLDLAASLDQYQRGIETLKECHQLLAVAERRITLLSGFDADGNPVTSPFDEADMSLSEKQSRRGSRRGAAAAGAITKSDDEQDDSPGLF